LYLAIRKDSLYAKERWPEIPYMFSVYVIKSESSNKIYIGQTSNLEKRLIQHNDLKNNFSKYTKRNKGPWKLIYKEEFETRSEAIKRERFLKSGKGRDYIKQFIVKIPG